MGVHDPLDLEVRKMDVVSPDTVALVMGLRFLGGCIFWGLIINGIFS